MAYGDLELKFLNRLPTPNHDNSAVLKSDHSPHLYLIVPLSGPSEGGCCFCRPCSISDSDQRSIRPL